MAGRLADEKHSGLADLPEIQAQVLATDRIRVLVARAIGNLRARERIDETIEARQLLLHRPTPGLRGESVGDLVDRAGEIGHVQLSILIFAEGADRESRR
jgi:hypothetical protein